MPTRILMPTRSKRPFDPDNNPADMDRVIEAAEADDMIGFCAECGDDRDCTEPDARQYECDGCGAFAVHGWMVWMGAA